MNAVELLSIITSGETSRVQFKQTLDNQESVAAEMIAMSNSKGGVILFGVEDKTGQLFGLEYQDIQHIGNKIATIANDSVKPPIYPLTEVVSVDEKKIMVVEIEEGNAKPYKDNKGVSWIKTGADKRRIVDNNEQARLLQQSGLIYLDEMIVPNTSVSDIDHDKVRTYVQHIQKGKDADEIEINNALFRNLSILRGENLTLGGLLFFSKQPQRYRAAFCIKAIAYYGNSIGGSEYRSSRDIDGDIPQMFDKGMDFFKSNLQHLQAGQNFNSVGKLEISEVALSELLQNALVHRDYSKNSPVRIMIFDDRVEIVSPGTLPNNLTIENIKLGNAVVRNNLIASYSSKLMPYRGFGSGIVRAFEEQPNIILTNDTDGEQFVVSIDRAGFIARDENQR